MTRFTNFDSWGAPRADLHLKPPSTMGHESVIQRRPSLSHLGWLKYFFQTYLQSVTLNYHTHRLTHIYIHDNPLAISSLQLFSQRIVFNVLDFLSWCHKRKADIKKRWGDIKTFGGISDPNGGWQTLLEKTPANNKCFIELLFCSYCSYSFLQPNQVRSLVAMIIIFAKDDKIHISAISS